MFKRFTISVLILLIVFGNLFSMLSIARAELIRVPVNCLCVEKKYTVYGEEQPQKDSDECFVLIESDPPVDEADVVSAPGEGSLGISDLTGISSVLSPLQLIFERSGMKSSFVSLLYTLFQRHTEKYHNFLDKEIFGKAIALVSSFQTTKDFDDFMKGQKGECSENSTFSNPKPNCVIERALCSYEKYVGVLLDKSGQSLVNKSLEEENTDQLLSILKKRDQFLLQEAQQAKQALDVAISVYSQFYQSYRLHLRFKTLIVSLARVRDMTKYLKDLVSCLPSKFVGAATTKCN